MASLPRLDSSGSWWLDIAGHSSAAVSPRYTPSCTHCHTVRSATHVCYENSALGARGPRGLDDYSLQATPGGSLLIATKKKKAKKRERRVIEALTRRRGSDETCNCSSGLLWTNWQVSQAWTRTSSEREVRKCRSCGQEGSHTVQPGQSGDHKLADCHHLTQLSQIMSPPLDRKAQTHLTQKGFCWVAVYRWSRPCPVECFD